jgi:hypothetical protein
LMDAPLISKPYRDPKCGQDRLPNFLRRSLSLLVLQVQFSEILSLRTRQKPRAPK